MSCVIYNNVTRNEIQGIDRQRVEMMVEIYESADDFRTQTDSNANRQQPLQRTGSESVKNRSHRSVVVCLVVLCVLLLTAVIVLCILNYTNNHQFNNITQERDQLLTKYTNITEEKKQLLTNNAKLKVDLAKFLFGKVLTKYINITEERDELRAKYINITKLSEQLRTHLYEEWIYYETSLYFISSQKKNWSESRRYCRDRGADLIIINNREEQDFIKKNSNKGGIWIGLSDIDVEGTWKWVDNSTMTSDFWRSGEPNGGTKENCVESESALWNDLYCHETRKWICERNIFK